MLKDLIILNFSSGYKDSTKLEMRFMKSSWPGVQALTFLQSWEMSWNFF